MAALSERKIEIVRTLVRTAPDKVVGGLHAALADTGADSALAGVRRLVEGEVADRRLRNFVLEAVARMCVGDGRDPRAMTFPAAVLGMVWNGLKADAPQEVAAAAAALAEYKPEEGLHAPFDALARIAAYAVRRGAGPDFLRAAGALEAARPGGVERFAGCLDIAPVVRRATLRLPEWIAHVTESAAACRLAYKDAVAISDDAGPRFFEMLAAQMAQPWMVLRVICAVMDKPTERYLADSEMAGFGERVMAEIDEGLHSITHLDLTGGAAAGWAAGKRVELITLQTAELEACIDLSKDHGWGGRIAKQKKALAAAVEARLRDAEKLTAQALPRHAASFARMQRNVPRLSTPPDPVAVSRATLLLAFVQEIRTSANYGGFAAARGKALEKLGDILDVYVEEVLDYVRTGDAEDESVAEAFLEVAAGFSLLIRGEKACELVRRRTAAAMNPALPLAAQG